jgi:hypothetical protein
MQAGPDDVIRGELSRAANVLLPDDANFAAFRSAGRYNYFGA